MIVLSLSAAAAYGQDNEVAKRVYRSAEQSVFLIYLNDSKGAPTALGSAFVVAPRMLITNAHVVEAGDPVLAVGPVRIPLKVVRRDRKNDLALLSVEVDLTSPPLQLDLSALSPGEQVFAIGNPEGLEKTISQGILSGHRTTADKDLLQVTSPISHGSSGGPILNGNGQVIGVAVGILESGQNLNFAVPVSYVRSLLDAKTSSAEPAMTSSERLLRTKDLLSARNKDQYSNEAGAPYVEDTKRLLTSMSASVAATTSTSALADLACLGTKAMDLSDDGISAAKKLQALAPSIDSRALLSYTLYDRAQNYDLLAQFAKDGSPEQAEDKKAHDQSLADAEKEAAKALADAKGKRVPVADFVLGRVHEDRGQYEEAITAQTFVIAARPHVCADDLTPQAYRALVFDSAKLGKQAETESWFRQFAANFTPSPYDWDQEGDRRDLAKDHAGTADAYERAANGEQALSYDFCYAATSRYQQDGNDGDSVLKDGRQCVEAAIRNTDKNIAFHFEGQLPLVYRVMAMVLDERGVYQQALEYIKESLSSKPDDALSLDAEAQILLRLKRYTECIAISQAAIRSSDGKYPFMHFNLGSCYFETADWSRAADSFRLAAVGNKRDAEAAFNTALSFSRQGFTSDAREWFNEALKRSPGATLRGQILDELKR